MSPEMSIGVAVGVGVFWGVVADCTELPEASGETRGLVADRGA